MKPLFILSLVLSIGLAVTQSACNKPKRTHAEFESLSSKTSLIMPGASTQDVISILGQPDSNREVKPSDPSGAISDRGFFYCGPDSEYFIVLSFKNNSFLHGTVVEPTRRTRFPASSSP